MTAVDVLTAVLWAAIGAVAGWLVTWPLRRRSVSAVLLSLTLTCTAASAGAMLGAAHSMLLPMGHESVVLAMSAVAGVLTAVAAVAAARRVGREHAVLSRAVADLGTGVAPAADEPRLSIEVARVRDQLRSTAADLAASREREQALERSRRELVAWMSHDLRTPLAGLRAMAEALEDGVTDDPARYYKQIGVAVDRLDAMVDDLFDLSRIQAGALGGLDDQVSVDAVVGEVIAALDPLAASHQLTIGRSGSANGHTVRGDGAALERAVTNLVANAIRHTAPDGRIDVTVETGQGQVRIAVGDQCGGIDAEVLPRVFDVGFRGTPARTADARGGGAGLGLAITRGIVEAHHGTVGVANTDDGCRFEVRLPHRQP